MSKASAWPIHGSRIALACARLSGMMASEEEWSEKKKAPAQGQAVSRRSSRIIAAAFSAIMMVGELVLPEVMVGITEASTTRRP